MFVRIRKWTKFRIGDAEKSMFLELRIYRMRIYICSIVNPLTLLKKAKTV